MKLARIAAIVLLAFLGITSIVGAVPMLLDPHGQPWQLPQNLLDHSPFHSYLIPGLVLLAMNGLLSLAVLALTVRRGRDYGWWIAAQGSILFSWLAVECAVLRVVALPHYIYGAVALALVTAGLALRSDTRRSL